MGLVPERAVGLGLDRVRQQRVAVHEAALPKARQRLVCKDECEADTVSFEHRTGRVPGSYTTEGKYSSSQVPSTGRCISLAVSSSVSFLYPQHSARINVTHSGTAACCRCSAEHAGAPKTHSSSPSTHSARIHGTSGDSSHSGVVVSTRSSSRELLLPKLPASVSSATKTGMPRSSFLTGGGPLNTATISSTSTESTPQPHEQRAAFAHDWSRWPVNRRC
eukprot:COSAG03_NODE_5755_length_1181_cov_133.499076_1_plen_220_part_00